jgi:hypothetical protein
MYPFGVEAEARPLFEHHRAPLTSQKTADTHASTMLVLAAEY